MPQAVPPLPVSSAWTGRAGPEPSPPRDPKGPPTTISPPCDPPLSSLLLVHSDCLLSRVLTEQVISECRVGVGEVVVWGLIRVHEAEDVGSRNGVWLHPQAEGHALGC